MKNPAPPPEQLFEMVFGRSFPDSLRATTMPRQLPSDLFFKPGFDEEVPFRGDSLLARSERACEPATRTFRLLNTCYIVRLISHP